MSESIYTTVSVNFKFQDKASLSFPFMDYGFLYGYGLFETVRVAAGKPILLEKHLERLRSGATILDIPMLHTDSEYMTHIQSLIAENHVKDATLNIYLTPGDREADLSQLSFGDSRVLILLRQIPEIHPEHLYSLSMAQESFQRTPLDRFKTMSWMKNVLERKLSLGYDDVLLYSSEKEILEASMSNVFFVKGDLCYTSSSSVVLRGITRQFLLSQSEAIGFDIVECQIMKDDLKDMEEVFLTNSVRGVMLVESVKGMPHLKSGKISRLIQIRYRQLLGI